MEVVTRSIHCIASHPMTKKVAILAGSFLVAFPILNSFYPNAALLLAIKSAVASAFGSLAAAFAHADLCLAATGCVFSLPVMLLLFVPPTLFGMAVLLLPPPEDPTTAQTADEIVTSHFPQLHSANLPTKANCLLESFKASPLKFGAVLPDEKTNAKARLRASLENITTQMSQLEETYCQVDETYANNDICDKRSDMKAFQAAQEALKILQEVGPDLLAVTAVADIPTTALCCTFMAAITQHTANLALCPLRIDLRYVDQLENNAKRLKAIPLTNNKAQFAAQFGSITSEINQISLNSDG